MDGSTEATIFKTTGSGDSQSRHVLVMGLTQITMRSRRTNWLSEKTEREKSRMRTEVSYDWDMLIGGTKV
jgi:hypothetical protein